MGAATIAVAHRHSLDVPKDLTVCGFGDTPFSRSSWPELTTIREPIGEMSREAVLLLLRQTKTRRVGEQASGTSVMLNFTLVRRDSDGPAARRVAYPPLA